MKNLLLSLSLSAASGAFTLLRPADWSPRVRRAYVLVPGALIAAGTAAAMVKGFRARSAAASGSSEGFSGDDGASSRTETGTAGIRPAAVAAVLVVGVGAAMSGMQALSLRLDAAIERWLVRHGASAPRVWMAAAVALFSLVQNLLLDRGGNRSRERRQP